MLEQAGYDLVGEAATSAGALAGAPDLDPDIVMIDVVLPDGHGFELARLLRGLLPEAMIVLCSGAVAEVARQAAGAGADGWLDKSEIRRLVPFLERLMTERC
jgi:two-component system, NarL family, response regulator DevR